MKTLEKVKIYWNGKYLRDLYPHATKWQVFKYRVRKFFHTLSKVTVVTSSLAIIILWSFQFGKVNRVDAQDVVMPKQEIAPVMVRIAKAESLNSHYCTDKLIKHKLCKAQEKGQVLVRGNTNGSVDVGTYQINVDVWGADATKQGLNIFEEKDNELMAIWIYENFGTGPWSASYKNWK